MSTFDGLVSEFPDIRIDYFRQHPGRRPPLACFLSHVHSDHLAGLESLRSPFVYCSAATKAILLRLERYPCRINFAKGILEARVQTFKAAKNILKPLPLETPTTIELEPGNEIQVTLFDANHCPGAVMFLIECSGKAVLYTGDVRSEPWFVNSIARKPGLVHYTGSSGKVLDKIYLDTSFTENLHFQTKAEGIQRLLQKVELYPPDTIFHFLAWTYGYEDVWIALSKALGSKIHVDDYKMRVYSALTTRIASDQFATEIHLSPEAPALTGFMCGNKRHEGCLTQDENVRLHSCEKGNYCSVVRNNSRVVRIQPVVAVLDEKYLTEVGVGGGGDDLNQEPELDINGREEIAALCQLFGTQTGSSFGTDWLDQRRDDLWRFINSVVSTGRRIPFDLDLPATDALESVDILKALESLNRKCRQGDGKKILHMLQASNEPAPILFPYSRHSSYPELRHLVEVFRPRDVWPCTVHPQKWLEDNITIQYLFGDKCRGGTFAHDEKMRGMVEELEKERLQHCSQYAQDAVSEVASANRPSSPLSNGIAHHPGPLSRDQLLPREPSPELSDLSTGSPSELKRGYDSYSDSEEVESHSESQQSVRQKISRSDSHMRIDAYLKMIANARGEEYEPVGLLCTTDNHQERDLELGDD